jgi:hypothetical protein
LSPVLVSSRPFAYCLWPIPFLPITDYLSPLPCVTNVQILKIL